MSSVKQITLFLITLFLRLYSRITKAVLWVDFADKVKKVRSVLSSGKLAIFYKVKEIGNIRYSHLLRTETKEVKALPYALWCKPSFRTSWYEGKILYIGIGMLTLSTVLLAGILIGVKQEVWDTSLLRGPQQGKQQEKENVIIAKDLEVMPKSIVDESVRSTIVNKKLDMSKYIRMIDEFLIKNTIEETNEIIVSLAITT